MHFAQFNYDASNHNLFVLSNFWRCELVIFPYTWMQCTQFQKMLVRTWSYLPIYNYYTRARNSQIAEVPAYSDSRHEFIRRPPVPLRNKICLPLWELQATVSGNFTNQGKSQDLETHKTYKSQKKTYSPFFLRIMSDILNLGNFTSTGELVQQVRNRMMVQWARLFQRRNHHNNVSQQINKLFYDNMEFEIRN